MKYLFLPIHWIIGGLIRLIDYLTAPKPLQRPEEKQKEIDESCQSLTLFHYPACPFCVKVRRNMRRLNLPIEKVDPRKDPVAMDELTNQGGKVQVPCLKISEGEEVRWMYESSDINSYLEEQFS